MYDANEVLQSIDDHTVGVLLFLAVSVGGMYLWFVEGLRVAAREQAYSFPVFCTLLYLAHDTSFVVRVDKWFDTYDHWFVQLFWVALIVTSVMEAVALRQVWRYGRDELAPNLSPRAFGWVIVGTVVTAMIIWASLKDALGESATNGDDLYMYSFGLTVVFYPPFAIALMLRRGSSRGQSVLMWVGFGGIGAGYFGATIAYFGSDFRGWEWVTMAVFSVAGCVVGGYLVHADRQRSIFAGNPLRRGDLGRIEPGTTIPSVSAVEREV